VSTKADIVYLRGYLRGLQNEIKLLSTPVHDLGFIDGQYAYRNLTPEERKMAILSVRVEIKLLLQRSKKK
jgi:hypothetical protein